LDTQFRDFDEFAILFVLKRQSDFAITFNRANEGFLEFFVDKFKVFFGRIPDVPNNGLELDMVELA
jgi:hypothetical protein